MGSLFDGTSESRSLYYVTRMSTYLDRPMNVTHHLCTSADGKK